MKIKQERICQVLNLDPVKQKPKKEETPKQVSRYLQERAALARQMLRAPPVSPFAAMTPKEVRKISGTFTKLRDEVLQFLEPLRPQLDKFGCSSFALKNVAGDIAESYIRDSRDNHAIAHLTFPQYAVAHLYLRADIPLWLAFLPQIREAKILANWGPFYDLFNQTMEVMRDMSPALYRQLFRGMYDTDTFVHTKEGDVLEINQPSSCSQEIEYSEEFMHHDKPEIFVNRAGEQSWVWGAPPQTAGDVMMQVWDVQDCVNNASVWECPDDDPEEVEEQRDNEHLLLEGTKLEVLLKATAPHPKSHRPVTFIVAQDVRSKVLGQQPRLLEALHLDQGDLC